MYIILRLGVIPRFETKIEKMFKSLLETHLLIEDGGLIKLFA